MPKTAFQDSKDWSKLLKTVIKFNTEFVYGRRHFENDLAT